MHGVISLLDTNSYDKSILLLHSKECTKHEIFAISLNRKQTKNKQTQLLYMIKPNCITLWKIPFVSKGLIE